jgi:hypothetical protein
MAERPPFDPYAILAALDRRRVAYVVIGSFARVIRGAEELPNGLDIVPSLRSSNLERLEEALADLGAAGVDGARIRLEETHDALIRATSPGGELKVVPEPEGTRGYDDLRRAATREPLGRGLRPSVASTGDLARMLAALGRDEDRPKLQALRQVAELERPGAASPRPRSEPSSSSCRRRSSSRSPTNRAVWSNR